MVHGILEVVLVDARGLKSTDFLAGKVDPYVVIQYRGQERKSSVAREQGSNPSWNETFTFRAQYPGADTQHKITLRIMDKDTFTADDFLGESMINVTDVIALGAEKGKMVLPPQKHSVVLADRTYFGEIRVGFTFTAKEDTARGESFGGWSHSSC
ncbi:Elicitor-responsive protein 1 [Acorus calamus]|uniref:Elicitor-responsive protein 1 n=1 Tax=Acorus calamus TaxID=4465 RepID=A0AAV9F950_ACOCL|nr:Elicitor-responsive protein 1 [Acorus calamus]